MIHLLNQKAKIKTDPTLDEFGNAAGWGSITEVKCRFINRRRMSTNDKDRQQMIEGDFTTTKILKLGDQVVIDAITYEVYGSVPWRDATKVIGSYSQLVLN